MIKEGMFISDRYEIISKVGSGGMADVYKAMCHRLNRYVAIKILKQEFSSDANFVQKFRAEAQSVAGLSHPNIVSVYDVGDDDGLHYIVMELVEGITLKRFIEKRKQLDVKEAIGITIQIAMGMEAAHNHHIIHRDIKPQNIIISREGKVKVADFGIAKAATSNTISQNAIGSVHYLSPEQARGGYSDERSDIYSLGVTLYEMLTGNVPFTGDNSVSVALSHIQSEAVPVRNINPDVPLSIDKIIQKCMQKKPERRYQTASELIQDLKRSVINPDGDYVNIASNSAVADSPTRNMSEEDIISIKSAAKSPVTHIDNTSRTAKKKIKKEVEELDSMTPLIEKLLMIATVLFSIAVIVAIIWFVKKFLFSENGPTNPFDTAGTVTEQTGTPSPTPTQGVNIILPPEDTPSPTPTSIESVLKEVPPVIGLTIDDAKKTLGAVSKDFEIVWKEEEYSDEYEKGLVTNQYPAAQSTVVANAKIELTVSAGSEIKELVSMNGKTMETAKQYYEAYGYTTAVLSEPSRDVPEGCVIRTDPEGGMMVPKGSNIVLYISTGPEIIEVPCPDLLGKKQTKAEKLLTGANLKVGAVNYVYNDSFDEGLVCHQDYSEGTMLKEGTIVNFTVSKGSEPVEVTPPPTPTPVPEITPDDDNSGNGDSDSGNGGTDDFDDDIPTATPIPVEE